MGAPIEAVRGMRDVLPADQRQLIHVQTKLEEVLARSGYTPLDLPIVEHRDLYLRKLGEELVGKVYEFNFGGRDLALRPEWTASVLRAYVTAMQDQPLPLRLSYRGPVFRYERPQRFTYRQFTQMGIELVGGPAPRADAEVLALACAGLDAVSIDAYRIRLGHIGFVRDVLTRLGLHERTQSLLVWGLERMRTEGITAVRDHLSEQHSDLPFDPSFLGDLDDTEATALLLRMLQTMRVNLSFGTRSPEEIVSRLVRKLRREDPLPRIEQALALLAQLIQIQSSAEEALDQAGAIVRAAGIETTFLDELQSIVPLLNAYGIPSERLLLDFGLGRGLHYYTGLIFEIYDRNEMQLCGGGRYDDLVQALGGRQGVPAVGFAYGLERVVAACERSNEAPAANRDVLVVAVTDDDYSYALDVAHQIRQRGFTAIVDVRGRSVATNLRDATRRNMSYLAVVGSDERSRRELVWRNLARHEEQRVSLDALHLLG